MSTAVIPASYIESTPSRLVDWVAGVQRFLSRYEALRSAAPRESAIRFQEAEALRALALRDFYDDAAMLDDLYAAADRHERAQA